MHLGIAPGMKLLDDVVANKEFKRRGAHTVQGYSKVCFQN